MAERHISFEQLSDVMAFRIIVDDVAECYCALGLIHRRWPMVPGRFKDYISTPKRNGYRSLHTSVIHDSKMRIEIQIRSQEIHEQAERGLPAHWAYKEGRPKNHLAVSFATRSATRRSSSGARSTTRSSRVCRRSSTRTR